MSEIKRYDSAPRCRFCSAVQYQGIHEYAGGRFVTYEDYAALEQQLAEKDKRIAGPEEAVRDVLANLKSIVQELFERQEYRRCFFDDEGDCAPWKNCLEDNPNCPLVRLALIASFPMEEVP